MTFRFPQGALIGPTADFRPELTRCRTAGRLHRQRPCVPSLLPPPPLAPAGCLPRAPAPARSSTAASKWAPSPAGPWTLPRQDRLSSSRDTPIPAPTPPGSAPSAAATTASSRRSRRRPANRYTLSFWLSHGATDNRNSFSAWWDTTPLVLLNNWSSFTPTQYTFIIQAAAAATTVRFSGHALQDYYYLDDVSVAPIPTPEPATLLLVLGGAAMSWRRRRR